MQIHMRWLMGQMPVYAVASLVVHNRQISDVSY